MPPFNSTAFAAAANAAADLVLLSSSEPPPSSPPPSAPWTVCTDEQRTVWPFLCTANDKRLGLWRAPALEAAMAKARAKAVRFYADDPAMPEPI